jgi:hypothetical protein
MFGRTVETNSRERESSVRMEWVLGSHGRRVRLKIYCDYEWLCKERSINPITNQNPVLKVTHIRDNMTVNGWWSANYMEGSGSWLYRRISLAIPGIYLEGLRKTTRKLGQHGRCPGWYSNGTPPEYESRTNMFGNMVVSTWHCSWAPLIKSSVDVR